MVAPDYFSSVSALSTYWMDTIKYQGVVWQRNMSCAGTGIEKF